MASAKHLAIRPEILRPRYPIEYEENSSEYTSLGKAKVKVQSTWQYTSNIARFLSVLQRALGQLQNDDSQISLSSSFSSLGRWSC